VLDTLRRHGKLARSDLARCTELAKPTISNIIQELIYEGFVREAEVVSRGTGRPVRLLTLDSERPTFAGIELGRERVRGAIANAEGRVLHRYDLPTDSDSGVALDAASRVLSALLAACRTDQLSLHAVGVAAPGLVDRITGECVSAPQRGWRNVRVQAELEARLGLPVAVASPAQASALAEARYGRASALGTHVWLYVGEEVGAAWLEHGHLASRTRGFEGALGHCLVDCIGAPCVCGRRGCVEAVCSVSGLQRAAQALTTSGLLAAPPAISTIRGLARGGDAEITAVFQRAVRHLGRAVSTLIHLLDPQLVLLGGELVVDIPELVDDLARELRNSVSCDFAYDVAASSLGRDSCVFGALALAQEAARLSQRKVDSLSAPAPEH
jgi:predicted NBD/HSP70 family sugar kinase